jgi:hypothetical protein
LGKQLIPDDDRSAGRLSVQLFGGHPLSDALCNAIANRLIDVPPIRERARQDWLGHSVLEVADDVGDQPVALGVVHDLAHQGAGLTEVIVRFV